VAEFSGERAYALLEEFCAIGPRVPGSAEHRRSLDWLVEHLRGVGDEVYTQSFVHHPAPGHPLAQADTTLCRTGLRMFNIVCRFDPHRGNRILLAAHWDCRPFCDADPDTALRRLPVPGANDAASAVAVLLELARIISAEPLARGVDIVLFDGEDFGRQGHLEEYLLGSRHFAANLPRPAPRAAILLDMVGDADLRLPIEAISWRAAPELCREVWETAELLGHQDVFVDEIGAAITDDHVPLLAAGIPAIDIIDFDFPEWHTTRDTPATCAPRSLQIVGEVMLEYLRNRR